MSRARKKITKEEVIATIKEYVAKKGYIPRQIELERETRVGKTEMRRFFPNYGKALRAAGVEATGRGNFIDMAKLFMDWAQVVRKLGAVPNSSEYVLASQYTQGPLMHRFGPWRNVAPGLVRYAEEKKIQGWDDVLEIARKQPRKAIKAATAKIAVTKARPDRRPYGAPLSPCALAYAPKNENGVLCLFGALAMQLGFAILAVGSEFPDCEAIREVAPGTWEIVIIEFEFRSRNFRRHRHDAKKCDLIVCWEHDWPECPLEVVELKKVVMKAAVGD